MQTTANFQSGDIIGQVRRRIPSLDSFDEAVLTNTLLEQYPGVREAIRGAFTLNENGEPVVRSEMAIDPVLSGVLTIFNAVSAFVAIALRVQKVAGIGWDTQRDANRTFRAWLADVDLQQAIKAAIEDLDNPNGPVVGKATAEQAKDPLSGPPNAIAEIS